MITLKNCHVKSCGFSMSAHASELCSFKLNRLRPGCFDHSIPRDEVEVGNVQATTSDHYPSIAKLKPLFR